MIFANPCPREYIACQVHVVVMNHKGTKKNSTLHFFGKKIE